MQAAGRCHGSENADTQTVAMTTALTSRVSAVSAQFDNDVMSPQIFFFCTLTDGNDTFVYRFVFSPLGGGARSQLPANS